MAVLAAVALTVALAAAVGHESVRSGPAARQIRQGKALAEVRGWAVGPMSASSRRGWDCQAEVRLAWVTVAGVRMPSDERIILFARSRSCLLQQGGQYRARGLLEPSAYGRPIPWLAVEGGAKEVEPPGPCRRLIARMQRAFLEQTSRLDDQGRILVPGLTMGILGNQALPGSDGSLGRPAVEPAYATRLTQDFRTSGILHLMAVSGGHFMILASMLVRIMRALRSPPLLMALVLSAAYLGLGMLMVPGDSVLRAQAMGLLSALALAVCRPAQSLNTLSWCVLLMLILRPSMAASFGFALSCGAVLGIGLGNRRLAALLEDHLPTFLARPLGTTLCAQAGTLPVQVLMSPGLPLLAPLANLLVTPVVDAATVTGLLALLTSWLWPPVGLFLARLTSLGTGVMALAARWLGEAAAPAAWPPGPVGSACLVGLGLMAVIDHRLFRFIRALERDHSWPAVTGVNSGVPFQPSAWVSIKGWLRQTYGLLAQLVFKNDRG
ncbi:ComEC/Rec2 family competence protein [Bifidobacterium sp. ESL0819]|uniref:ComEC/Rec2 family competence protein n=1 Tax=Bifidobacterium sp. ESL0819 TaxID=3448589 RepID=UPI0040410D86